MLCKKMSHRKFIKEEELQICDMYNYGFSSLELAKIFRCNYSTICNILKRNGYKTRTISEAKKGKFCGKDHPMYGKHHSLKSIRKMKRSLKGRKAWNKGTKGIVKAWNKGLTNIYSKETIKRIRIHVKRTMKDPKIRQKIRETNLLRIQNHLGPFKDTKPELKMEDILISLNIPYEKQYRVSNHLADFHFLNTNILAEVDGDYYHGNPKKFSKFNKMQLKQKERDIKNDQIAKKLGYTVLRFWENDILNNAEKVKSKIMSKVT